MELYEWTKHYIKFKDCMKRNIKELIEEENKIKTHEKKENKIYLIAEDITTHINETCKEYKILVTLNTKKNVDTVINNWKTLITEENLSIIFANPQTNETWTIHPKTHHKISEKIKEGLLTLYESITTVD